MEDRWIAVDQTNEVVPAPISYLSETFWMFYILQGAGGNVKPSSVCEPS